jgi:osmotically-inducible protein OsmY
VTPDAYVVGHVRDALAHEGVTDVHAAVVAGRLVLTGHVATASRREEVSGIAAQVAGDLRVVNELAVLDCPPPEAAEELA